MKILVVKGTGRVEKKPDTIELDISLDVSNAVYESAYEEANRLAASLKSDLAKAGFKTGDIKTASYVVETEYENVRDADGSYRREMKGYKCAQRFLLTFAFDLKKLGKTIAAIASCEAKTEFSVRFTLENRNSVEEELLTLACADAGKKAEILARASGVGLGKIAEIRHDSYSAPMCSETVFRPQQLRAAAVNAPDVTPDDVKLEDSVTVTWELAE